jgi:uncharacterized membrane protein
MDFKKHLLTAWELTLRFIVPLVVNTLVMVLVGVASLGILAPVVAAGFTHSVLLMLRENREPKLGDLFSQMGLFLPLLGFGVAVFIALFIGFLLLVLPGVILAAALVFFCLYMLPLMTDRKLGLTDAIKESYAMARENPTEHLVVALLFLLISALGGVVMLGTLFTQPLATVFLLSVYEEKMGRNKLPPAV